MEGLLTAMSPQRISYLSVFIIAFLVGLYVYKYHKGLWILVGLMALGLVTEGLVEWNKHSQSVSENFIYNLYIPLEYFMYAFFFYRMNTSKLLRRSVLISLPVFLLIVIYFTDLSLPDTHFSSVIYSISGFLIVGWSIWSLFEAKPIKGVRFRAHPMFWICMGLLIFYAASAPFNSLMNYLQTNYEMTHVVLSIIIQKGMNILLYLFITIGFLCSHQMRK